MLSVVATPIGNLDDTSPRALETLRSADFVLCEDTRVTRKLLSRFDIHTKTLSYHSNTTSKKTEGILQMLEEGKNLALVSDAGTPTISDPGARLVSEIYLHFGTKVSIVAIPGPSAVVTALSISGLPASDFLFLGFLPRKKGKKTLLEEISESKRTTVFYESPHRIVKTLEELASFLSKARIVVLARELTKLHEEVIRGTMSEVCKTLNDRGPENARGEFVVLVSGEGAKV